MDHVTQEHERALIDAAARSTCQRDQRGALVVWEYSGKIISIGWNGQPQNLQCNRVRCEPTCARSAEHAEAMSIRVFPYETQPSPPLDLDMVHGNVVDGEIVVSRTPAEKACVSCAVQMFAHGISGLWLLHADGWTRHIVEDYHRLACNDGRTR